MFNLRPHAAARRKPTAGNRDSHLPQRGPFNIFNYVLDRMRLGIAKYEKLRFSKSLCSRLSLSLILS